MSARIASRTRVHSSVPIEVWCRRVPTDDSCWPGATRTSVASAISRTFAMCRSMRAATSASGGKPSTVTRSTVTRSASSSHVRSDTIAATPSAPALTIHVSSTCSRNGTCSWPPTMSGNACGAGEHAIGVHVLVRDRDDGVAAACAQRGRRRQGVGLRRADRRSAERRAAEHRRIVDDDRDEPDLALADLDDRVARHLRIEVHVRATASGRETRRRAGGDPRAGCRPRGCRGTRSPCRPR